MERHHILGDLSLLGCDHPELADSEAVNTHLDAVRLHAEQAVVAKACRRGVCGVSASSADHPNKESLKLAANQASVTGIGEHLVTGLPPGRAVAATVTGVDDDVAVILVVHIPAGYHDRVRTLARVAVDTGHPRGVHASFAEFSPAREV